jgi:hypothetical protein
MASATDLHSLSRRFKALGPKLRGAITKGMLTGALRGVSTLQRATTKAKAVNTGRYRMGWKYQFMPTGVRLYNDTPYAAIIEFGRRWGRRPPIEPLAQWAMRKLGLTAKEARSAAFAIANSMAKKGIPGKHVIQNSRAKLERDFKTEIKRACKAALLAQSPEGDGGAE